MINYNLVADEVEVEMKKGLNRYFAQRKVFPRHSDTKNADWKELSERVGEILDERKKESKEKDSEVMNLEPEQLKLL